MNAALFGLIFRRHFRACLACGIPPVFVAVVIGFLWPELSERQDALRGMMSFFENLAGGGVLDMFSVRGMFQLPFQHPLTLLSFAIAAGLPALSIPAGERGRGGLELLLSTSLERRPLIGSVLAFQLLVAPLVALSPLLGIVVGTRISGVHAQVDLGSFGLITLLAALLLFAFAATATLISVLSPDLRVAAAVYASFALLGALCRVVAQLWEAAEWVQYCSPLAWYQPPQIVVAGALAPGDVLALLLWGGIAAALAVVLQDRRRAA